MVVVGGPLALPGGEEGEEEGQEQGGWRSLAATARVRQANGLIAALHHMRVLVREDWGHGAKLGHCLSLDHDMCRRRTTARMW